MEHYMKKIPMPDRIRHEEIRKEKYEYIVFNGYTVNTICCLTVGHRRIRPYKVASLSLGIALRPFLTV